MYHLADIITDLYFYKLPVLIHNNNILSTLINLFADLFADLRLEASKCEGYDVRD